MLWKFTWIPSAEYIYIYIYIYISIDPAIARICHHFMWLHLPNRHRQLRCWTCRCCLRRPGVWAAIPFDAIPGLRRLRMSRRSGGAIGMSWRWWFQRLFFCFLFTWYNYFWAKWSTIFRLIFFRLKPPTTLVVCWNQIHPTATVETARMFLQRSCLAAMLRQRWEIHHFNGASMGSTMFAPTVTMDKIPTQSRLLILVLKFLVIQGLQPPNFLGLENKWWQGKPRWTGQRVPFGSGKFRAVWKSLVRRVMIFFFGKQVMGGVLVDRIGTRCNCHEPEIVCHISRFPHFFSFD